MVTKARICPEVFHLPFPSGSKEKGSALLLAFVAILLTSMSVLLVAGLIRSRRISFDVEERNVFLTALVDSAMAESLAGIDENKDYSGVSEHALGRGSISSRVVFDKPGYRSIEAEAHYDGWKEVIEARVDVRREHPVILSWSYRLGPL